MRIAIDCGHTLRGGDTGAEGCGRLEQNCTREIGGKLAAKLQALGNDVRIVSVDNASSLNASLSARVNNANNWGANLYVSIHLNAGGGRGTEVYTYGGREMSQARNVLNNICNDFGYVNRGLKGASLYVINHTNMPAMLIECCFIDSSSDMSRYDAEKFANAICRGLVGSTSSATASSQPSSCGSNYSYSVPQPAYQTKFSALVQMGQIHANNFACGAERIAEDGICGPATKKARIKVLQQALNLDYNAGLVVDGDFGSRSKAALGSHYVKRGEKQYMVTALEILLYLNNYDPKGLENPGSFGPRLEEAVVAYQRDHHLSQDGICGKNTFLSLLA